MTVTELTLQLVEEHPDWTNQQVAQDVKCLIPGSKTTAATVSSIKTGLAHRLF